MNSIKTAIAAAAVTLSLGAHAALIDDFNGGLQFARDNNAADGTGVGSSVAYLPAIGGFREVFANKGVSTLTDPSPGFPGLGVEITVVAGSLGFSQDTGQGGLGIVRYHGNNAPGSFALNNAGYLATLNRSGLCNPTCANLSITSSAFQITVLSADAGFGFELQAFSDAVNWSNFATVAAAGPAVYVIPFAAFLPAGGIGANFGSIGALQALLNTSGTIDVDLRIDIVSTVPTPGSLALVGLALVGLGLARRKTAQV